MEILRGAPLTEKEKKELNIRGREISRNAGIWADDDFEDYDILRNKRGFAGFASYYIGASWDRTELVNKADINVYKELILIDEKLGTKMTEQLEQWVRDSYRKDLFKV